MRGATILAFLLFGVIKFLLTHLMRGATDRKCYIMELSEVSTHAPHARCDGVSRAAVQKALSFYSRTSCEVRLGGLSRNGLSLVFLLTHLMRGATY